jgi:acyl-CoA thioesterase FadM
MANKKFTFLRTVYLGDLNIFGTTYFASYFIWQGVAREAFFKDIVKDHNKFMKKRIKLITIEATMKFKGTAKLYDDIEINIIPVEVTLTTVKLVFKFFNKTTGKPIGEGSEKIGFTNLRDIIIPLPEEVIEGGMDYLDSPWKKKVFEIYKKVKTIKK